MNNQVGFAVLQKVDAEKRLIYVRAAQEVPDLSGEIMDYSLSKPHFQKWSDAVSAGTGGLSKGNLRSMHGSTSAGRIVSIDYNDDECAVDMCLHVNDDNEWRKTLDGNYRGVSIGGSYGKKWDDNGLRRYEAIISELSLVDSPCIPTATFFSIHKSDGSVMRKSFQTSGDQIMPATLAKSTDESNELNADAAAVDVAKSAEEIEYQVEGTAEDADALAKLLHDNKLSIGDAVKAVQTATEAPLIADLAKRYEGDEIEADFMADLLALEKVAARADVNPKAGESKYGDVKFADEKNNKYPIENEAHIRAAWNYINKAKNAEKYSAEDLSAIKGKIEAAWKAKIDKAGPPSAEKALDVGDLEKGAPPGNQNAAGPHNMSGGGPGSGPQGGVHIDSQKAYDATDRATTESARSLKTGDKSSAATYHSAAEKANLKAMNSTAHTNPVAAREHYRAAKEHGRIASSLTATKSAPTGDLAKGISDCGRLGEMLQALYYCAQSCKAESAREGDNSDIPARLTAVAQTVAQIYKDMATEEADELVEDMGEGDNEVMQMAYGLAGSLAKAGARNSAADADMLQKMHDLSAKLGASCSNSPEKMMNENETTKSTEEVGDLEKGGPGSGPQGGKGNIYDAKHMQSLHNKGKTHVVVAQHAHGQHEKGDILSAHNSYSGAHKAMSGNSMAAIKTITEHMQRCAEVGDLAKSATDMQKMIADAVEPLHKALGDAMAKITMLEAQPLPVKGVLRVVSKENDLVTEVKKAEIAPIVERDGSTNAAATMFKSIHATGGAPLIGGMR